MLRTLACSWEWAKGHYDMIISGKYPYLRNIFLVDTKPQGFWEQRVCTRRWFWQVKQISFYEIGISGFLCFISFALSLQFEGMERLSKGLRGSFVAGFSKSALGQSY